MINWFVQPAIKELATMTNDQLKALFDNHLVDEHEIRLGYYGQMMSQNPSAQQIMMEGSQAQANALAAQQNMAYHNYDRDNEYKSDIQRRIDEYNRKYAGKNKEEVDRQEREKQELARKIMEAPGLCAPMTLKELMDFTDAHEVQRNELPKQFNVKEFHEVVPMSVEAVHVFHTTESTYCGVHNTVDTGGCHVCKEHSHGGR